MPEKILIDTDPGVDDTMAILTAFHSPELEIVGLTSVFGNTDSHITAANALRLVELEGNTHIPVAQGSNIPLVMPVRSHGKTVHHEDGMGGANLPPPKGSLAAVSAAELIVHMVMDHPGEITLMPIGPLTNIALALRLEPRIATAVKRVVIIGGAAFVPGNASPKAEANIHNDPESANIVFSAGWDLTMVGLDVTHKTVMTPAFLDALYAHHNPSTEMIQKVVPFYQQFFKKFGFRDGIPTHDPSATAYLIDPSLFTVERMPVYVETAGLCSGETAPDPRHQWHNIPPVNICVDVNSAGVLELLRSRLTY